MTEATVTIRPAETVSVRKGDLAAVAKAARLFQRIFDGELTDCEAIGDASDLGLTDDEDCDCGDPDCDVETAVFLKPTVLRAIEQAEELAAIAPEEDEADG